MKTTRFKPYCGQGHWSAFSSVSHLGTSRVNKNKKTDFVYFLALKWMQLSAHGSCLQHIIATI